MLTLYRIGPMDTLIAAHARAEGVTLVTNNTREFARVPDLKLEDWTVITRLKQKIPSITVCVYCNGWDLCFNPL